MRGCFVERPATHPFMTARSNIGPASRYPMRSHSTPALYLLATPHLQSHNNPALDFATKGCPPPAAHRTPLPCLMDLPPTRLDTRDRAKPHTTRTTQCNLLNCLACLPPPTHNKLCTPGPGPSTRPGTQADKAAHRQHLAARHLRAGLGLDAMFALGGRTAVDRTDPPPPAALNTASSPPTEDRRCFSEAGGAGNAAAEKNVKLAKCATQLRTAL